MEVSAAGDLGLYRTLPLFKCHPFQNCVLQEKSLINMAAGDVIELEEGYRV